VICALLKKRDTPPRRSEQVEATLAILHRELEKPRREQERLARAIRKGVKLGRAYSTIADEIDTNIQRLTGEIEAVQRRAATLVMEDATLTETLSAGVPGDPKTIAQGLVDIGDDRRAVIDHHGHAPMS
jgi:hypothetical protein